jgi:hypothetical protein
MKKQEESSNKKIYKFIKISNNDSKPTHPKLEKRILPKILQIKQDGLDTEALNKVIKLENINEELPIVGDDIKLEIKEVLHMNSTDPKNKEHENWKDYYNPGLIDRVYKMFEKDIKKYNYEFNE